MFKTPILFLVFNRPDTTAKVFNEIKKIKPERLFIAADGPREHVSGDKISCEITRNMILSAIDWPCEIKTLLREHNLGCEKAVSSAITWFFDHVESGIILEDDCLPNDSFFDFCEMMLSKYQGYESIGMISGSNFLFNHPPTVESYFFSKCFSIWGWATWKEKWNLYQHELIGWDERRNSNWLSHLSPNKNVIKFYTMLFDKMSEGLFDTWDINWTYSLFVNNQLALVPIHNFVSNIGISGTHTDFSYNKLFNLPCSQFDIRTTVDPKVIIQNTYLDSIQFYNTDIGKFSLRISLRDFFKKINWLRVIYRVKRMLIIKK